MPACADLELCKLPNRPLGEEDGHGCRLGCGGRLHGLCGEPEEEGGSEIHRVCNPCIAKKQNTPDSSNHRKCASKAVEEWAGLEEQAEFADTLSKDAEEIFMEKVTTRTRKRRTVTTSQTMPNILRAQGLGGKRRRRRSRNWLNVLVL